MQQSDGRQAASAQEPRLKRSLTLPLLTLYGLGTTIGAGIFVLLGEVVAVAGVLSPLAFLLAAALAGLTALSFAELSARFPLSAGEAVYVDRTLGIKSLGLAAGLAVALAGLISSAAIADGFVGYLRDLAPVPPLLALTVVVGLLGGLAGWGIKESVVAAAAITVLELATLAVVAAAGLPHLEALPQAADKLPISGDALLPGLMAGVMLAFFAFIGFEDMVNVAEEVREAERILPRAIVLTLVITTGAYLLLALVAVSAPAPRALAESGAPLAALFTQLTGADGRWISVVALVSVLNGALIQIVMASRVLYGLSRQGWLPPVLGRVHPRRRTPLVATGLASATVLVLATAFPIRVLAEATSFLMLAIFATVNFGLWRYKTRGAGPQPYFSIPREVALAGAIAAAAMLAARIVALGT